MLCQLKWKYVLTPPGGSEVEIVYLPHPVAAEMEIGAYPTLWQLNGKRYLPHPVAAGMVRVTSPHPVAAEMERGTYPTLWQ